MPFLGVFRTIRRIYSVLTLLLFVLAVYIGMYTYTVAKTDITDVAFNRVTDVDKDGFTLEGRMTIHNGGVLTIDIEEITYNITLESDGTDLANGSIPGVKVKPKGTADFNYSQRIPWSKSVAMGLEVKGNSSNLGVQGDVVLTHFGLYETRIPYKTSFDLGGFVKGFFEEHGDTIKNVAGSLADLFKSVATG